MPPEHQTSQRLLFHYQSSKPTRRDLFVERIIYVDIYKRKHKFQILDHFIER